MIFRIQNPDGTHADYVAPTPDTITVSQWRHLVIPPIEVNPDDPIAELEANYEMAHRFAGIPKEALRRLPISEFRRLMEAFSAIADAATEARKDKAPIPDTITHLGVTYRVPKDPGQDIIYGQYIDLEAKLRANTYEDEGLAAVLGVCLMEGEAYDGNTLDDRIKAFESLPAMQAIPIAAFFFAGCPDLERLWSRYTSRNLRSRLLSIGQTMDALKGAMAHSAPSAGLPA